MNRKVKRIAAIIGLVLFGSIFLINLIAAFFATEQAPGLFLASLFSAVVIPIMIWAFLMVYRMVHRDDPPTDTDADAEDSDGPKE